MPGVSATWSGSNGTRPPSWVTSTPTPIDSMKMPATTVSRERYERMGPIVPAGCFADSIRLKLNTDECNLCTLTTTDTGGCMSLNVKTRKVDGVVIIDLSGRLTIGEPVLLLRETLRVQVNDGARNFILNLADVAYIDSSGLGELVSAYTTVRNKQGDVKLLNLTTQAMDLLQMTKLLTVFDVYDDEAAAISKLKAARPV